MKKIESTLVEVNEYTFETSGLEGVDVDELALPYFSDWIPSPTLVSVFCTTRNDIISLIVN